MFTIEHMRQEHPIAIAIAFTATGNRHEDKVTSVALKIFESATGLVMGEYYSLVKISRQDWDQGEPDVKSAHGLTYDRIESKGLELSEVAKQIGTVLKLSSVFERGAVYLASNVSFQRFCLNRLFPEGIPCPTQNLQQFHFLREIHPMVPKFVFRPNDFIFHYIALLEGPPKFQLTIFPQGELRLLLYNHQEFLGNNGLVCDEVNPPPQKIVDDIYLVYCKILGEHPVTEEVREPDLKRPRR